MVYHISRNSIISLLIVLYCSLSGSSEVSWEATSLSNNSATYNVPQLPTLGTLSSKKIMQMISDQSPDSLRLLKEVLTQPFYGELIRNTITQELKILLGNIYKSQLPRVPFPLDTIWDLGFFEIEGVPVEADQYVLLLNVDLTDSSFKPHLWSLRELCSSSREKKALDMKSSETGLSSQHPQLGTLPCFSPLSTFHAATQGRRFIINGGRSLQLWKINASRELQLEKIITVSCADQGTDQDKISVGHVYLNSKGTDFVVVPKYSQGTTSYNEDVGLVFSWDSLRHKRGNHPVPLDGNEIDISNLVPVQTLTVSRSAPYGSGYSGDGKSFFACQLESEKVTLTMYDILKNPQGQTVYSEKKTVVLPPMALVAPGWSKGRYFLSTYDGKNHTSTTDQKHKVMLVDTLTNTFQELTVEDHFVANTHAIFESLHCMNNDKFAFYSRKDGPAELIDLESNKSCSIGYTDSKNYPKKTGTTFVRSAMSLDGKVVVQIKYGIPSAIVLLSAIEDRLSIEQLILIYKLEKYGANVLDNPENRAVFETFPETEGHNLRTPLKLYFGLP